MSNVFRTPGAVTTSRVYGQTPVRFFVGNPNDVIQSHHAQGRFYEIEELGIIERHYPRGGVYLDVGANVGNHLLFMAAASLTGGMIAIEPNPKSIEILVLNILLNDLRRVIDTSLLGLGFSDGEGRADAFTVYANNLGQTEMQEKAEGAIRLVSGDSVLGERKVDFIKIDVEGHEMKALAGLSQTIARNRPMMFIEVDEKNYAAFDTWLAANRYEIVERFKRYVNNENFLIRSLAQEAAGSPRPKKPARRAGKS